MAKAGRAHAFDPRAFLATIGHGKKILSFFKKPVVFTQGDPADSVFYVQKSKVRLTVVSQTGREATITSLIEGSFFGEGPLGGQARNIRYEDDLVDPLFNSSEKRLARILLLLAHFGKDGVSEVVLPKISQETLAEMVGTTRSRVSFSLNRFRKLGFVARLGVSVRERTPDPSVSLKLRTSSGKVINIDQTCPAAWVENPANQICAQFHRGTALPLCKSVSRPVTGARDQF